MNNNMYLLTDEVKLCKQDYDEREKLIKEFKEMPEEFFSKMRHFQPQIGCLNACEICSKTANTRVEFWEERRIRNIIAALKYASPQAKKNYSLITYDRYEHRNGVIFPYLDNDIGNYPYLDLFIRLAFKELGVTTRISTVSYSRYNEELNDMHKKINLLHENGLGGVRLSFTPYEIGWCSKIATYSQFDYILDMANLLEIYKPYYELCGAGSRKMCVELRYKPLVEIERVFETEVLNHKIICVGNYLFISKQCNVEMREEPLTPIYERNYGMYNSKMKEEGVSWRLSCNYGNSIVIEKLNMYDTASVRGQVAERKINQLNNLDEIYTSSDLKTMYLVPGERLK